MDNRKWQAAANATPPAVEASPSSGYPTDGNPSTPTPATIPGAFWFHQIGEEIRAVIAAAGLTPTDGTLTQLRDAIQAMLIGAQKAVIVSSVTFEASVADGEAVRWDSGNSRFDEAIADGTANNRAVGIADVTNSRVYLYGECPLFSGLTPGARYYLHGSTAGALTATAPADAVRVGIAKSATVLWVDIDEPGDGLVASNIQIFTSTGTLPNSVAGGTALLNSASAITETLPAANALPPGSRIEFMNINTGAATVQRAGSDTIQVKSTTVTSLALKEGDTLTLMTDGTSAWYAVAGSAQLYAADVFAASMGGAGWQKLPSGLIVQWGIFTGSSSADVTATFPVAFPTAVFGVHCTRGYTVGSGTVGYGSGVYISLSQAKFRTSDTGQGYFYIALGN